MQNRSLKVCITVENMNALLLNQPYITSNNFSSWHGLINCLFKICFISIVGKREDFEKCITENNSSAFHITLLNLWSQGCVSLLPQNPSIDYSNPFSYSFDFNTPANKCAPINLQLNADNYQRFINSVSYDIVKITNSSNQLNLDSWESLRSNLLPINSIIICDQYFFSYEASFIPNAIGLIDSLLGNIQIENTKVDITIFFKLYFSQTRVSLKKFHEKIISEIIKRKENLKYKINLTLVQTELEWYHDRKIITNSYLIETGNSFSFYDRTGKIKLNGITNFEFYPVFHIKYDKSNNSMSILERYFSHLTFLKKLCKNGNAKIAGSNQNRILNFLN